MQHALSCPAAFPTIQVVRGPNSESMWILAPGAKSMQSRLGNLMTRADPAASVAGLAPSIHLGVLKLRDSTGTVRNWQGLRTLTSERRSIIPVRTAAQQGPVLACACFNLEHEDAERWDAGQPAQLVRRHGLQLQVQQRGQAAEESQGGSALPPARRRLLRVCGQN